MPNLRLILFGPPRLECDDRHLEIGRSKSMALLAYLAVTGEPQQRDKIVALLWPDADQTLGRSYLRRDLAVLNKTLGPNVLEIQEDWIQFSPGPDFWLDVQRFRELLKEEGDHAPHTPETTQACIDRLTQAIELYRADFLEGFNLPDSPGFDEWQFFEREKNHQALIGGLQQIIQCFIEESDFQRAIVYAQRWLTIEPWNETAHRELMKLYAWSRNEAAALRQYRNCARMLQAEYKQLPDEETQALYEDIRTRRLPLPPRAKPVSTETLNETSGYPAEGRSVQAPRHNLPLEPNAFIGREADLEKIVRLLQGETNCRLLTLAGPGGIGKSRLALRAADLVLDTFSSGVFFVQLAALASADLIIPAIGEALGLSFQDRPGVEDQLVNFLQAKQLLLILDNLDHVLEGASIFAAILTRAPKVKILVTSRERLNMQSEWVQEVRGLPYPNPGSVINGKTEAIAAYPAVALFLERAHRGCPDFSASENDMAAIARICQLVEGIPLGLELAAAWVRLMPCREIANQIEQNFDFLATTIRDVPDRHRSLRKLFDYTWALLTPEEQQVLIKLAVFQGGLNHAAGLYVAGASLPALAALVDKSVVSNEASGRFNLHRLLRHYLREKFASQPETARQARDKHCAFYTSYLKNQELALRGADQHLILAEITVDIDNIRAAWQWAVEQTKVKELNAALESLHLFFFNHSWYREAVQSFDAAAKAVKALTSTGTPLNEEAAVLLARLLARQGRFTYRLGQEQLATKLLRESLEIIQSLPNSRYLAGYPLYHLSEIARGEGRYQEAEYLCKQSLDLYTQSDDEWGMARAINHLGILAGMQGSFAQAETLLQQALYLYRECNDAYGIANALNDLGIVSDGLGKNQTAWLLYQEGLAIRRRIGQPAGIGASLNNMGYFAYLHGRFDEARQLLEESLLIQRDIGDRFHVALCLNNLGAVMAAMGQPETARRHFSEALQLALKIDILPLAMETFVELGKLLANGEAAQQRLAAELFAFAAQHSVTDKHTRDQAQAGLNALAEKLTPEELSQAQAHANAAALNEMLEHLYKFVPSYPVV